MPRLDISRTGVRMPPNRSFEREVAQLDAMSGQVPDTAGVERIRKALGHENNYLVAKAARLVADHALNALCPEVLAAYDRFFIDAVKRDPQCWAKNALAKALVELECRDVAVFMKGLRHHQEEPVWGGQSDTAGALRAACTQALIRCEKLSHDELLGILVEPMADTDKSVRMAAAHAIGQVGGTSAALLLKLRILVRKDEPEVLGACFSALLSLDKGIALDGIALVADFLDDSEEAAAEAAFALAETHDPAALAVLIERRKGEFDSWFGAVLDNAIALTRLEEGLSYLLRVIEEGSRHASSAIEAISRVHRSDEMRTRVALALEKADADRLWLTFHQHFPTQTAEVG